MNDVLIADLNEPPNCDRRKAVRLIQQKYRDKADDARQKSGAGMQYDVPPPKVVCALAGKLTSVTKIRTFGNGSRNSL